MCRWVDRDLIRVQDPWEWRQGPGKTLGGWLARCTFSDATKTPCSQQIAWP